MIPTQGRCTGTIPQQQAQWHPAASQPLKVPYGRIIPDARPGWTPNNSSAFLNWMAKPWWSLMAPLCPGGPPTATGSESTIFTAMVADGGHGAPECRASAAAYDRGVAE